MSRLLENPKVFAIAAALFMIATIFNFSVNNATPGYAGSSLIAPLGPVEVNQQIGPTLPPNPWEPSPKVAIGPTLPPNPWEPSPKVV